ncbi:MAG: hypothetical protein M3040_07220 [Bacteroidota bacterium]|nr:hypothetical protein [Bacteroidota bacterium]
MLKESLKENKSKLVQIMNEVDELSEDEKSFVLYWIRAKKNAQAAAKADLTVLPNDITTDEIYNERDTARKQKV